MAYHRPPSLPNQPMSQSRLPEPAALFLPAGPPQGMSAFGAAPQVTAAGAGS